MAEHEDEQEVDQELKRALAEIRAEQYFMQCFTGVSEVTHVSE